MEAFATVASGAGLVSLAIQLLESSQKLKGLYNASRNAPRTIEGLCFELETLSLQLRQLERHRHLDRLDTTEVLDRCIAVCQQRVMRVRDVVDAMSRYMRRSSTLGGVYTAFKEPEMRKLIVELEQAKSSLSLAYISYCQSWNMRDSTQQALALQQHRDLLALQQLQLDGIQQNVARGNSLLASRLTGVSSVSLDTRCPQTPREFRAGQRRIGLRLPLWLTTRTWTLAAYHSQGAWTVEIHPEIQRAFDAPALDFIRTGDIANVKQALDTGKLSIWDSTCHPLLHRYPMNLLGLAVYHGQIRLCDYLLTNVEHFRRDDQLHQAAGWLDYIPPTTGVRAGILELFAAKYDMDVYVFGPSDDGMRSLKRLFYQLSKVIMSHQPMSLEKVSFKDRFNVAMKFRGRSPADFLTAAGLKTGDQLLAMTDETGSTVLHWAALHWSLCYQRVWPPSLLTSYGDFIVDLVKAGSSVSAINKRRHSPLMYLLAWEQFSDDWNYGAYDSEIPHDIHPSQIVSSWCMLLNRAGVPLTHYLERENVLLSRLGIKHPVQCWWRGRTLELKGISLGDQATFTLEVYTTEDHVVWENRPPPGTFMDTLPDLCRLPWYPASGDDSQAFWQVTETKTLKTSKPFRLSLDSIDDVECDLGRVLFGGIQDDHMMLATVYRREQQRIGRSQNATVDKKRASSTPPADKRFVSLEKEISHHCSPKGYPVYVHKCLQDFHWGFCKSKWEGPYGMRATCMAGCSGRPDHGAQIADAFLSQEKSVMTPRERWLLDTFPRE